MKVVMQKNQVFRRLLSYWELQKRKVTDGKWISGNLGVHLVALAMPEDYGISGFQRELCPPNPFLLT
jgi:DNA topoisomerase-3